MSTLTAPPPPAQRPTSAVRARPEDEFDATDRVRDGVAFMAELGDVPLHRVLFDPPPGTVTGTYYEAIDGRVKDRLVELVNGTLVEKCMGMNESRIASNLNADLLIFVRRHKLGFVAGEAGTVRMTGGNRPMPDVAVYLAADYPDGVRPTAKVPAIPPRIAVEVLNEDNTAGEIALKLGEYFANGCRLAYVIDPEARAARRHTAPADFTDLAETDQLDGGDVLPGFTVALADVLDG